MSNDFTDIINCRCKWRRTQFVSKLRTEEEFNSFILAWLGLKWISHTKCINFSSFKSLWSQQSDLGLPVVSLVPIVQSDSEEEFLQLSEISEYLSWRASRTVRSLSFISESDYTVQEDQVIWGKLLKTFNKKALQEKRARCCQRPTPGADLICIHRQVTSRNQGTFSR